MIRLMIADSHPILVQGFISELESEPDIRIVAEANNPQEAIKKVAELKPDVILLDVAMLKDDGLNVLAAITIKNPGIKIIIETIDGDSSGLIEGMRLGADAYLPVCPTTAQTKDIIRRVAGNHTSQALEINEPGIIHRSRPVY